MDILGVGEVGGEEVGEEVEPCRVSTPKEDLGY